MATTTAQEIGANVRAEMARLGISQNKIAAHMNLSQTAISARLRGVTPFDVNELSTVADYLQVAPEDLLPRPVSA